MGKCGTKALWLFILLFLVIIVAEVLVSGDILLYLAPRMVPMVWFGLFILAGLSAFQCFELVQCFRHVNTEEQARLGILLFVLPVLLILTVKPNAETPGMLPNKTLKMVSSISETGIAETQQETEQGIESITDELALEDYLPCVLVEDERAIFNVSTDLFSNYLLETAEALDGRTITVYGFVYYDESFPQHTVLVSRLMINCCAADAATVGFHVKIEVGSDLEINEWIRVTGTIQTIEMLYYGSYYSFPILTDGLILRCDAPDIEDAYIYP